MPHTICYITPSVELLGARISLIELLIHLDRTRYRPIVVCPKQGPLTDRLVQIDVDYRIVRFGNWRKGKHWILVPFALRSLVKLCRQEHVELWHSNEFWSFPYAYLTARFLGLPAISHFRCSRPKEQLPAWKMRAYLMHRADRIIAVSESQRAIFSDIPEVHDRFMVIPNGLDVTKFQPTDPGRFRKSCGIAEDAFLVGMVGPVSEHKGVEEFLRAAAIILKQHPSTRFAIVGPDRPRSFTIRMQSLVSELGIADRVIFTGFRHDIPNVMADLDLLVTPSRVEAFGRVLLEAMAIGTPIVASRVGGIPEIVSSEELGLLVPPRDAAGFAEAILRMLNDESFRKHLAANARLHVENEYSIQAHSRRVEAVYEQFLEQPRSR